MIECVISAAEIPRKLDPTRTDEFCQAVALANIADVVAFGTNELDYYPEQEIALRQPSKFESTQLLVAKVDGTIVGCADYDTTVGDNSDTAWVRVHVHPDHQRNGIGTALLVALETIGREEGKQQLHVYASAAVNEGPALAAPTGFGSVPRDNAETQFLLTRGFSFEQVERVSRLPLPVPGLNSLVDDAIDHCSRDYAVHEWIDICPEGWREDLAVLYTRMSTDAPSAELSPPEDVWTAERVVEYETRFIQGTITTLFAAIEHLATGALIGFTSLAVAQEPSRAVSQLDTIVLHEHRGHRLGMLLKVANLAHLERIAPGRPSVITFNAEENTHMLRVNEAVGFVPIGYEGAWKRVLN